jgi:hypothetical protein
MKEYKEANHNPVVIVNGDSSKEPIFINARVGTPVMLSAAGTSDPDGNKLKYAWFYYPEAASAISKPVKPEEVIGERGEAELEVRPRVKIEGFDQEEAGHIDRELEGCSLLQPC